MIQAKGPLMPSKAKERAERLFRQQQKAPKALADYRAKQEATRNLTATALLMARFELLRNLFGIYELNRRRWPKLCLAYYCLN